jgi:hypothetical protein
MTPIVAGGNLETILARLVEVLASMRSHLQPEGTEFEPAEPGHRMSGGDLNGLIEGRAFENVEAHDPLLRLSKRTIGHQ